MSIHSGHRQRLKDRFLNEGLDHFQEVNVLELLLFYVIPKQDTNPVAHELLKEFGSLTNVLEASEDTWFGDEVTPALFRDELSKVKGIGPSAATFISLVHSINRYYNIKKSDVKEQILKPEQYISILGSRFLGKKNELVFILCLDANSSVICCRMLEDGTTTSAHISVRKVIEAALAVNATSVVLAHNHPGGYAIPSKADTETTKRLANALSEVEVQLVDHIIFSDTDCCSVMESSSYRY